MQIKSLLSKKIQIVIVGQGKNACWSKLRCLDEFDTLVKFSLENSTQPLILSNTLVIDLFVACDVNMFAICYKFIFHELTYAPATFTKLWSDYNFDKRFVITICRSY
jgi:hypothetical protein